MRIRTVSISLVVLVIVFLLGRVGAAQQATVHQAAKDRQSILNSFRRLDKEHAEAEADRRALTEAYNTLAAQLADKGIQPAVPNPAPVERPVGQSRPTASTTTTVRSGPPTTARRTTPSTSASAPPPRPPATSPPATSPPPANTTTTTTSPPPACIVPNPVPPPRCVL